MRFLLGLLCGLLALGGYIGFQHYQRGKAPCGEFCGEGTTCVDGVCQVAVAEDDGKKKRKRRRHRRRWRRRSRRAGSSDPGEQLKKPSASDLVARSKGQRLEVTDYVDMEKGGGSTRELSTAEVTTRFRKLDRKIIGCIDRARGDYDIRSGKINVGFRIERSGAIKRVRVTGPAVMMKAGLYGCISRLVRGLRFPASSRALVMTYPFALR
jgi:hypothetical protein